MCAECGRIGCSGFNDGLHLHDKVISLYKFFNVIATGSLYEMESTNIRETGDEDDQ
jgi:hypothetical protein